VWEGGQTERRRLAEELSEGEGWERFLLGGGVGRGGRGLEVEGEGWARVEILGGGAGGGSTMDDESGARVDLSG